MHLFISIEDGQRSGLCQGLRPIRQLLLNHPHELVAAQVAEGHHTAFTTPKTGPIVAMPFEPNGFADFTDTLDHSGIDLAYACDSELWLCITRGLCVLCRVDHKDLGL